MKWTNVKRFDTEQATAKPPNCFLLASCCLLPWSQRFPFAAKRLDKKEKEGREKTSGCGRCESHYHATIAVTRIN